MLLPLRRTDMMCRGALKHATADAAFKPCVAFVDQQHIVAHCEDVKAPPGA